MLKHFKKTLVITGITAVLALVIGVGIGTMIYHSDMSERKKKKEAEFLGQMMGLGTFAVIFPFWIMSAAAYRKEKDAASAVEK